MGWSYQNKDWKTIQEFFEKQFKQSDEDKMRYKYEVLESSLVNRREAYAAIKMIDKVNNTEEVFAATYLVNFTRDAYYNFGYKSMDESYGPGMYNCPEKIMKLLTPTKHKYAIDWRKSMWDKINKRKELCKQLKVGNYFYMDKGREDEVLCIVKNRNINYIYFHYVDIINGVAYFLNQARLSVKRLTQYNITYIPAKDLEMKIKELNK